MPKPRRSTDGAQHLPVVPWITKDGTLDLAKLPIEPLLQQTLGSDQEDYRSGCVGLGSMCARGRAEAGVFLLGLLQYYRDDLVRLAHVAESLAHVHTAVAAQALANELVRVKRSNATHRYLDSVLHALSVMPPDLVEAPLTAVAQDRSLMPSIRRKVRALLGDPFNEGYDEGW
jgi:hypothetical protein